jgi:adenosylcobinamide-GDP ribazoletransferase
MLRRIAAEFFGAFLLLTRLPMPRCAVHGAACLWAYPLVGVAVGSIGAIVFWLASSWAPSIAALLALAAMSLATGALHEDGLADTADGFGGGRTPAEKLAIMRDSRIGTFGALVLLFSVLLRSAAITQLATPGRVAAALVGSAALARGAIIVLLVLLKPARSDGLAASLGAPTLRAAIGLALAVAIAAVTVPLFRCLVAAAICVAATTWLTWRQIGGHTGDVLGAGEQVCECALLCLLTAG